MKVWKTTSLKRAEFFLAGMRAQSDECGRRILLGDYISGGAGMVRPIRFQCVGIWFPTGLYCSIHIYV